MKSLVFRRSIYVADNISKGEPFTEKNLRIVRPGYGGAPYLLKDLIGKISPKDLKRGTPLGLDQIL